MDKQTFKLKFIFYASQLLLILLGIIYLPLHYAFYLVYSVGKFISGVGLYGMLRPKQAKRLIKNMFKVYYD